LAKINVFPEIKIEPFCDENSEIKIEPLNAEPLEKNRSNRLATLRDYVDLYLRLGFCVIPVPYGEKGPKIIWQPYQERKPTDEELRAWFGGKEKTNIAIVCGGVSGNLVVLDFDDVGVYEKFFDPKKVEKETLVVITGSGKRHVYFRTPEPISSFKIPELKLEIRSEGNIVVTVPSLHPCKKFYQFADPERAKTLEEIPVIRDLVDMIWKITEGKFGVKRPEFDFEEEGEEEFTTWTPLKPWKGRNPPCIAKLLEGVGEGFRNEAAARLASFFLFTGQWDPKKAWKKLVDWNGRNRPPLSNRELESVFRSVQKRGYVYKCRGLSAFCDLNGCKYGQKLRLMSLVRKVKNPVYLCDGDWGIGVAEGKTVLFSTVFKKQRVFEWNKPLTEFTPSDAKDFLAAVKRWAKSTHYRAERLLSSLCELEPFSQLRVKK